MSRRNAIEATVKADEPAKGLIATAAHLPDLGAISIQASINGPRDALGTRVEITAGPLTASASGTVDLHAEAADLTVKARAPAMAPAAGISWQSVLVDATVHGPFAKPDANGTIRIDSLSAAGARIGALDADVTGNAGAVKLHATVQDLHIPGPKPDIFAADPVTLDASARLDAAGPAGDLRAASSLDRRWMERQRPRAFSKSRCTWCCRTCRLWRRPAAPTFAAARTSISRPR